MTSTEKQCCNCHCHQAKQVPVTLRDTFFQDPIFSRSWDEFDQMRRDMIAESRQAWNKFDEEMKRLETQSFSRSLNIESNLNGPNDPTPPKEEIKQETKNINVVKENETKNRDDAILSVFSPIKFVRFPSMLGDEKREKGSLFKEENVIKVKDDDKAFEITMDTSQYKPDELKVNVEQNNLTVEAKHTEQSEDGRNFVSKQFCRRYTLPSDCKRELVASNLSADGVLVISAPKYSPLPAVEAGRNVPIVMA